MKSAPPFRSRAVVAVLLITSVLLSQASGVDVPGQQQSDWGDLLRPTLTDNDGPVENVTVQVGETAFLLCAATVGGGSPVWIRRKDYHILTRGKVNYINDQRFQVLHDPESSDWTLQIRFVQAEDNGTYECQVSSGSGYVSRFVRLHVFQPVATIPSGPEYHVQQGTAIQLVCVVGGSPTPPTYVFWYHGDVMINYDKRRGGISVDTESKEKTFSRLTITNANLEDSGNYSCKPSNADPAFVHVYVSQGDKIAAIQGKANGSISAGVQRGWLVASLSVIIWVTSLVTR